MGKRILITGASGLLGSYLVNELLADESYDLFLVGRNLNQPDKEGRVTTISIDFSTDWNANKLPEDLDGIIHLSQAENFRDFPAKAVEVFYINTLSTLKLIDYASKNKIGHFIYASSGGVYGTDGVFKEEDVIEYKKELGFYLGTKHCSEVILENYHSLLNVIILRFFFIYGKGQNESMLIPRLVNRVKNKEAISLQGEGGMRINPLHASDAAKAVIASLKLSGSHKFNVGGPDILSLKEICDTIGEALTIEPQLSIDESVPAKYLVGDVSKLNDVLGKPAVRFVDAVKTMI